ncbi:potassium channel family protein [Winogradskyella sp.]|uniref:potassium channel family protein n=1 Tax=Winogradskyella sp. TaxID=1883156 RepID=UPI0026266781|nr:potassium channel family protein [Winogradskyella sp.]
MTRYFYYIIGFFRWQNSGRLVIMTIAFILLGTLVYRCLEGWSWIDSYYFSVMTLTTVGYGEMHPTNDLSKIFTTVYIFSGLGIVLSFVTAFFEYRVEVIDRIHKTIK